MGTTVIDFNGPLDEGYLETAAKTLRGARKAVAFTGAGISVESGIPDFRSPGGLWTVYPAEEYGTLSAFLQNPAKAWKLFRAMAETVESAQPNPAHRALARLEAAGLLEAVITQNVDGLHRTAGTRRVVEVHGDHSSLQCVFCGRVDRAEPGDFDVVEVPSCKGCGKPLKPNVVLFEEGVRGLDEVDDLVKGCDLLMVVGTSAQVYPVAGIPAAVKRQGGSVFEFNLEETDLTLGQGVSFWGGTSAFGVTDVFFKGPAGDTLPALADRAID